MKHTKGKWHSGALGHIVTEFGNTICQMFKEDGKNYPNANANAKLIAAAPELLEALKEIVDLWNDPDNPSGAWDHVIHATAKGAIKKATE